MTAEDLARIALDRILLVNDWLRSEPDKAMKEVSAIALGTQHLMAQLGRAP